MKIEVDRTDTPEGNLVFTIRVTEPHEIPFGALELKMLHILEDCQCRIDETTTEENRVKQDVRSLVFAAKEKAFGRTLENMRFAIDNEFQPRFKHICQEIYNWIYDKQSGIVKEWLYEFDPQRTRYYFSNEAQDVDVREDNAEGEEGNDE